MHERLSTKAIIETLKGHRKKEETGQLGMFELFGDPQRPVTDQVLKAYEYRDKWVNRMILGDSLVVMNSLLHYEGLGGQVQMIYMDPPYGIKFGSNFQPFVRKKRVEHNEDDDMTREPEMVKAYRDTWELGLHSYLSYMRDRLLIARELLTPSGSVFVQISDENLHHVKELMDEVFGIENFCGLIPFRKTGGLKSKLLDSIVDYLLWYAKDIGQVTRKYKQLYEPKRPGAPGATQYRYVLHDGELIEYDGDLSEVSHSELCTHGDLTSQGNEISEYTFKGRVFRGGWKTTNPEGLNKLADANRIAILGNTLRYVRYLADFPYFPIVELWDNTGVSGFAGQKTYVVQTNPSVIQRCILMTTEPGDLVLDPTCGGGTTAYIAEMWGRRWITVDVSRVPLALARQRLLTATFPYYQLKDEQRGPAAGFVYLRRKNKKGEEVGGIVPHIMLESITNNEPPKEEVLVDRPEIENKITRVAGPFCVEATIPTPVDWEGDGVEDSGSGITEQHGSFIDRMLEVLHKSPVLHIGGGKSVNLKNIRLPAKTLSLSAEAVVVNPHPGPLPEGEGDKEKPVALLFGPENGAVSEKLVHEALKEANLKGYAHLYVIGFAIQANARILIENSTNMGMIPATYVQATPDIMMGDLLKNMRSSQIFSVCGLPEVKVTRISTNPPSPPFAKAGGSNPPLKKGETGGFYYQVELLGIDIFDPVTMETDNRSGNDVPAWFLDTNYNGLCFHVCQAFFPRTSAWDNLKRALKASYEETIWDHLAGTRSIPFEAGENRQIALKVIDDRGNELMVVRRLDEAEK